MAWTKEQELAINTRDRTLLVSAAAGSGKTATLTERIIKSILDEENPADIGRMLIVTYTNAATDELRERIGAAIKKAARENPENSRLEDQYLRLKDAKILTITSFCNSILRMSAENIGLAPNYRIAEPAEAKIISSSCLEGLINAAYEGELDEVCSSEEFISLADTLASARYEEGLANSFSYVFDKLSSTASGIDTLIPLIEEYNPDNFRSVEKTRLGEHLFADTISALSAYEEAYNKAFRLLSDEKVDQKNLSRAEADLAFIKRAKAAKDYDTLREEINGYFSPSLSRSGSDQITDFYSSLKQIRSYFAEDIKSFKTSFFAYSSTEWQELYTKLYKILTVFYKFLKKFYSVFMEEKQRRGICEFSDVERYAYLALYDEDGSISELAREISLRFDSIYIDEYQDVNELQNKVFCAISKENNRFMVGDIKQSIYIFRSARPEIFAGMKESFPPLGSDGDYPCASIFMSNNFRCDEGVINFVNDIFDTLFGLLGKNIGYVPEDKLKFSKIYPDGSRPTGHIPEIHIIEKAEKKAASDADTPNDISEEGKSSAAIMAKHIKNKISELLSYGKLADGRRIEPRDIAVLVRSVKGTHASAISSELKGIGIPVSVTDNTNLFMSVEVLLALSFLYSIDNPKRDVYLTALMCSPLYSFSADEILAVKLYSKGETMWDALLKYTEDHPDYEKGKNFIFSLRRYRTLSEGMPTDRLISFIYRESGLLALAAKNGGRDNLILLHSYAAKYEKSEFKGLYSFISFINAVIEKGEEYPSGGESEEENAVKIMTVHKSKGLEFPVTIIANASAKSGGSEGRIILSENFGISLKTKDDTGLALVDNPTVHIIDKAIKRSELDEEMRVLYVALTRAREQLYIYGTCPKSSADEYFEYIDGMKSILSPYFAGKAKTFLDMIMISGASCKVIIDPADIFEADAEKTNAEDEGCTDEEENQEYGYIDEELLAKLSERFSFSYPLSHLEKLPEKISISKLTPTILDEDGSREFSLEDIFKSKTGKDNETKAADKKTTLPAFMTGTSSRESAERGIATHLVMQFCNFELLEKTGAANELERLAALEFISDKEKSLVRTYEIDIFLKSELFSEIKAAKKIYRELRFNLKLPAEKFTEDDQKRKILAGNEILVQGVIDCLIENTDGSLHLVDYKTDRLTPLELKNQKLAEERLGIAHGLQLSYYADAVELMFGRRPSKVGIYSLHLGKEIILHGID